MELDGDEYAFDLQYLFDCYPIRKRLLKHLKIYEIYVLEFTVKGIDHYHLRDKLDDEDLTNKWAEKGYLNLLKWAYEKGCRPAAETYNGAAKSGRIDTLEWLLSVGVKPRPSAFSYAARHGHANVIRWLRDPEKGRLDWFNNKDMLAEAIKGGHSELATWMIEEGGLSGLGKARYAQVKRGSENIRTKIVRDGYPIQGVQAAAKIGDLGLVQEAYRHVCSSPVFEAIIVSAVKGNHMEVVKWLINMHSTRNGILCTVAAEKGNVKMLKYLVESGCDVSKYLHIEVALRGHHCVTKWLLENLSDRCPMDESTFAAVCRPSKRSFKAMKYLRRWGCPWDSGAYEYPLSEGNHRKILWLLKHGCPFDRRATRCYISEKTLRWLEKMGY
jgi:hypothetical protein